jgi:PEGA domain-containing protein
MIRFLFRRVQFNPIKFGGGERAAVFVDGQYAGHVDEFSVGKAMLLTPGQHRLRIALPVYLPFDTMVDLRPQEKLKIQTDLVKGSITNAGSQVSEH